jgi:hypothetical protein
MKQSKSKKKKVAIEGFKALVKKTIEVGILGVVLGEGLKYMLVAVPAYIVGSMVANAVKMHLFE